MNLAATDPKLSQDPSKWLKNYYFTRFAFSAVWVAAAFTVAKTNPPLAAILLIVYPAWDAAANFVDARRSGGLSNNKSQLLNFVFSVLTAVAVAIALGHSLFAVIGVFGVWAFFAGLFQLVTAVRRWKSVGAQWAMILSGAQSMLAGGFMLTVANGTKPVSIADIAPYAAFGAFYFLVSSLWLLVGDARRRAAATAA
ncbi:DUF308 domain-containing protein [Sphingosinithalassobacter portus]|uniref:DUF308 domain-containing protein n=1 Tax=Stakelama portus TaxID=2676234 RepID=UPI000D6DF270|nr:DUF308 domain-containing protein [Sphingosinithalassobacter portus]